MRLIQPYGITRALTQTIGVWLFHCHIEWHVVSGLMATFIEAPTELQKQITIPEDHLAVCKSAGQPTAGNAAGNTADLLDLSGQNEPPTPLPAGYAYFAPPVPSIPIL